MNAQTIGGRKVGSSATGIIRGLLLICRVTFQSLPQKSQQLSIGPVGLAGNWQGLLEPQPGKAWQQWVPKHHQSPTFIEASPWPSRRGSQATNTTLHHGLSQTPPPNSPPTHLNQNPLTHLPIPPPCLNHTLPTITITTITTPTTQKPQTPDRISAGNALLLPPRQPSRRASRHPHLHSPNAPHPRPRAPPPPPDEAHVRPRSRPPPRLQLPHRQTPRPPNSPLPPLVRPRDRTRLVHRRHGQRSRHGLHRSRRD